MAGANYLEKIINSSDFHFEKGREILQSWLNDTPLNNDQVNRLQELLKDYKKFAELKVEDEFGNIKNLFFEIISYCDDKGNNKSIYNKYDDNRTLAMAYVRMNNWCQHIYNYKYKIEDTSPSVFNALEMLLNPLENINVLSINHRNRISNYYLKKPYDRETFVSDIADYFQERIKIPINKENYNLLVAVEIYKEKKDWDINEYKFKQYIRDLKEYLENEDSPFFFGKTKNTHVWISDTQKTFLIDDAHYEIIIENEEISIDLHFEGYKKQNIELANCFQSLPDFLEWKPWQRDTNSISHTTKFTLSSENLVEESAECLYQLFEFTFPLLIDKLNNRYPLKKLNMNVSDEFLEIIDLLEYKKQIILKGPPGTGKTRMSEEISRYIIGNQINFETDEKFELTVDLIKKHIYVGLKISSRSGIDYFIEEVNPGNIGVKSANSKIWYPSFNQIIKSYNNKLYKEKNRSGGFKSYEDAVALYLESTIPNDTLLKINLLEINLEVSPYYKIVQFHPSFNYEDFVRGIISKPNEKGDGIIYEGENKILVEYANVAFDNPDKKYILVIDEINRANLSSVLGELIYTLEYRDKSIESMYKVDQDNSFVLPSNLYIIGTMNTADRSVNHIDYAIKRRFAFVDVLPKHIKEDNIIFHDILFDQVANIFQEHLSEEFSINDLQLGQSYFIDKSKEKGSMQIRLKYEIKPILIEYVQDGILKESALDEINKLSV